MNSQHTTTASSESRPQRLDGPEVHMRYQPFETLTQSVIDFARDRPDVAALWCFAIGFVLGWRLKP